MMNLLRKIDRAFLTGGGIDPLAAHRLRAMYQFGILAILALLPFAINNLIQGRNGLGVVMLAIVGCIAVDAIAIHRDKPPPIPYPLLMLPALGAIMVAIEMLGLMAALWCYPMVIFLYFVTTRHIALLCNTLVVMAATLVVHRYVGEMEAFRLAATLIVTILVTNIILGIIVTLQRQLLDQAITDPLTTAFNRRNLGPRLEEAIERRKRVGTPAALLLIDIDHFKQVNDRFGHDVGDSVLKGVVSIVRERARKFDSLFRIGGEEFLLLLADAGELDAMRVAEEFLRRVRNASLLPRGSLTVSIGVAELLLGDSAETWVKRADEALYGAKRQGRDCVVRSNGNMAR